MISQWKSTNINILGISHVTSFQESSQYTLLVTHMYTKIYRHQHKTIQLSWIHLVHACSIWKFGIVIFEACNIYQTIGELIRKYFSISSHAIYWFIQPWWSYKIIAILWELVSISAVQLHKNSLFILAYRNSLTKTNLCTLALCLEASDKEYTRVLIGAVGYQVSPLISLFCKSPLTTIINLKLSRIPPDCIFALYTSMHEVTGYPLLGSSIRNVWLLIMFLISFKIVCRQEFFPLLLI